MKSRSRAVSTAPFALSSLLFALPAFGAGLTSAELSFSGDLRARIEHFSYGDQRSDRTRARYRLRLAGKAKVNEQVSAGFRLISGHDDIRSSNQTLGSGIQDDGDNEAFSHDPVAIDRAFIQVKLPGAAGAVILGKMGNPLRWKNGKDYMLWDGDINPEGIAWAIPTEFGLYARLGYLVIEEESGKADPGAFAAQFGYDGEAGEHGFGGRLTWYSFHSLGKGDDLVGGAVASGNISPFQAGEDGLSAFELAAYYRCKTCIEDWPLTLFAHYARNTDAGDITGYGPDNVLSGMSCGATEDQDCAADNVMIGAQDTGYGIGIELGDKQKFARFGFGYYRLQADFFPSVLIDSDITDGRTNRTGFTFYVSRRVYKNTDFGVTLFSGDALEEGDAVYRVEPFRNNSGAERTRIQLDLAVKF